MVLNPADLTGITASTNAGNPEPDPGLQDFVLDARTRKGEELTVLQWLRVERDKAERRGLRFQAKAMRNELYYMGEQFKDVSEHTLEVEDIDWQDEVPMVFRNYMRPLINTFSARLQKGRPDAVAVGTNPGPWAVNGAEVANKLIYHVHRNNEIDDLIHQSTPICQCHGKVGYKIVWDPDMGRPGAPVQEEDELTGEVELYEGDPEGEVRWSTETIFDYFTDGSADTADSPYVVFKDHLDVDQARIKLEDAGVDEEPATVRFSDLFDEGEEGVEVQEIWHKPDEFITRGFYALVIGGHVTEYLDEYPYDHREIPLVEWWIGHRRGSSFGSSHVDDAVVIQRQINELVSVIHKLTRDCGQLYFIGHPAIIEAVEGEGNRNIGIANDKQRTNNGWIDPPNPPPLLFAQLENLVKVLYDVFGLNEILTGQENVRSGTSARQIEHLEELDSQKIAGTAKSLEAAIKRAWRMTLKLYQQFVQEERALAIAGPGKSIGVVPFLGADIDGVDIDLEPNAGVQRLHAASAAEAEQDMMNQVITPQEGLERRETGQDATQVSYYQQVIVQEQIRGALAGAAVQADPSVDPQIAVPLIQEAMMIAQRSGVHGMLGQNLNNLLQGYSQAAQQMQMQQMQQMQMQDGGQPVQGTIQ